MAEPISDAALAELGRLREEATATVSLKEATHKWERISNAYPSLIARLEAAERERDELQEKALKLQYLQNAGVDNWDGFDDAMSEYWEDAAKRQKGWQ